MARIGTEADLLALYGPMHPKAAVKVIDRLDELCRRWLALCPFALLATTDGERMDVSPKGDAPGFLLVEDEKHLLVPDWPGNNRLDGLRNILKNPAVGLITLVPGAKETIRINGRATIHDDEALLRRFETAKGRLPITVTRIGVDEVFMHCPKAFMRARLWEPESWPDPAAAPTGGELLKAHCALAEPAMTPEEFEGALRPTLY